MFREEFICTEDTPNDAMLTEIPCPILLRPYGVVGEIYLAGCLVCAIENQFLHNHSLSRRKRRKKVTTEMLLKY